MKILDLVLKGKWYDMEVSGEKPEEYREIKGYWIHRLLRGGYIRNTIPLFQQYTHVRIRRGYTNITALFPIKEMTIGYGNPEWGAPTEREVFIIKLGKREDTTHATKE